MIPHPRRHRSDTDEWSGRVVMQCCQHGGVSEAARLDGIGLLFGNGHDMIWVKEVSKSVWIKLAQDITLGFCYQMMVFWDVTTCAAVIFKVEDTFTLKMAAGTYVCTYLAVHGATFKKLVI
jgi:hypothetical protein